MNRERAKELQDALKAISKFIEENNKPEPREFWTVVFNNGANMSSSHPTKEEAEAHIRLVREDSPDWCPEAYIARVVEVLDD